MINAREVCQYEQNPQARFQNRFRHVQSIIPWNWFFYTSQGEAFRCIHNEQQWLRRNEGGKKTRVHVLFSSPLAFGSSCAGRVRAYCSSVSLALQWLILPLLVGFSVEDRSPTIFAKEQRITFVAADASTAAPDACGIVAMIANRL